MKPCEAGHVQGRVGAGIHSAGMVPFSWPFPEPLVLPSHAFYTHCALHRSQRAQVYPSTPWSSDRCIGHAVERYMTVVLTEPYNPSVIQTLKEVGLVHDARLAELATVLIYQVFAPLVRKCPSRRIRRHYEEDTNDDVPRPKIGILIASARVLAACTII